MNLEHDFSAWEENVSNFRFVVWDTETTGASPASDHLVEIAAIAFDEEFEHRRFESLVRPPISMPKDVIKIHGITDEMVEHAPGAQEVMGRFFEFLEYTGTPRVLLAHNASFDVGVIHGECKRLKYKTSTPPEIVIDTCMLAKALLPDLTHHGLSGLATYFKINVDRFHRAMRDVQALHQVFMKLLALAADKCSERGRGFSLNNLIDLAGGYFLLDSKDAQIRRKPFRLPPRICSIEPLCGTESKVAIAYETEENYRYITPIAVRMRGYKVYVEAFCHRDNIKKTFRADKILKIGKIEPACS